jgi:ribonuclease P protein component
VWHTPWFVLFFKKTSRKKIAFVAGKKVGKAVERNRAKRLLRAHFIEYSDRLENGFYIFVAKAPILKMEFEKRDREFLSVLKRCGALRRERG